MEALLAWLSKALSAFIPAVIGWIIIIKNGVKLSKRGEVQALCGATQKSLMDLIKHAEETWEKHEDLLDEAAENSLTLMVAHVELSLKTITDYYFKHTVTTKKIIMLRRFCTAPTAILEMDLSTRMNKVRNIAYDISNTLHVESYDFSHKGLTIWGTS